MNSWNKTKVFVILFNFLLCWDCVVSTIWWNNRRVHAVDSIRVPERIIDDTSPPPPPPTSKDPSNDNWWLPSQNFSLLSIIHRSIRLHVAGLLSTYGVMSSLSSDILSARARWQELRPTMESLQSYLNETGITNELLSVLQHRQFWVSLRKTWQIQMNQRNCQDIRNQVSFRWKQRRLSIPSMEDALRYVVT